MFDMPFSDKCSAEAGSRIQKNGSGSKNVARISAQSHCLLFVRPFRDMFLISLDGSAIWLAFWTPTTKTLNDFQLFEIHYTCQVVTSAVSRYVGRELPIPSACWGKGLWFTAPAENSNKHCRIRYKPQILGVHSMPKFWSLYRILQYIMLFSAGAVNHKPLPQQAVRIRNSQPAWRSSADVTT